jgi:hypothetical protein
MQHLHILLDDWQKEALEALARERGMEVETIARSLLCEGLRECLEFVSCVRGEDRLSLRALSLFSDTIEIRLKRLFEE